MPAPNIIPFPIGRRSGLQRGHDHRRQRQTVPRMGPPRQMSLPLPEDSTIERRIAAAKATIANYDDLAARSRPVSAALYRRFAVIWEGRLAALLEAKAALAVQEELLPPPSV